MYLPPTSSNHTKRNKICTRRRAKTRVKPKIKHAVQCLPAATVVATHRPTGTDVSQANYTLSNLCSAIAVWTNIDKVAATTYLEGREQHHLFHGDFGRTSELTRCPDSRTRMIAIRVIITTLHHYNRKSSAL